MLLTPNQLIMLADCIDLGREGCLANHVENGGTNTEADLARLDVLEEICRSMARRGVTAEVVIKDKGPASLAEGGHVFQEAPTIEWLTPVNDEDSIPPA